MPLPGSVTLVTVTEDYYDSNGVPLSGTVTFSPSVRVVVSGTTITVDPVVARVVAGSLVGPSGSGALQLAATDNVNLSPTGWTYQVAENVGVGSRLRNVSLPSTPTTRVLHTLAPVDPVAPTEVRVRTVAGIAPDATGNVALPPAAGAAPNTRVIATTAGLQGGGDLTADRTLSPVYGATAATVCEGNDTRLSNARTPLTHAHVITDVTGLQPALAAKNTKLVVRQIRVTTGNIPLNTGTSTWGPLASSPTLSIPAAVGDYVNLDTNAFRQAGANQYLDLGVVVSGQMRRYLGSGTVGTPAAQDPTYEGDSALYHTAGVPSRSSGEGFVVTANDLDVSGNVVFTFAVRNTGAGSPVLLASIANPLRLRAVNWGVTDFA